MCVCLQAHAHTHKNTQWNEMKWNLLIWCYVLGAVVKRHLCFPWIQYCVRLWNVVNGKCNLVDQWNRYHFHLCVCVVCMCPCTVCDFIVKLSLHLIKKCACICACIRKIINFILFGLWKQLNHTNTHRPTIKATTFFSFLKRIEFHWKGNWLIIFLANAYSIHAKQVTLIEV